MQHPQRTGAASSYAKKYAIGNLLLIDDTQDADATNTHGKSVDNSKPLLEANTKAFVKAAKFVKDGGKIEDIQKKYLQTSRSLLLEINNIWQQLGTIRIKDKRWCKYRTFTISINDETNQYGQNIAIWEEQTKEQREWLRSQECVGNGRVFWTEWTGQCS